MKLAIYQKGAQKPVIISDETETDIEQMKEQCKNVFTSDKIFVIGTEKDCFIGRPSEIQSILISADKEKKTPGV